MTVNNTNNPYPIEHYLNLEYTFHVIADPDGGYVVMFPDLLGCLTQFDNLEDLPEMVKEARSLWLETCYDNNIEIPLPTPYEDPNSLGK